MSQQQFFGGSAIPGMADIQFIAGSNAIPVPPNPATHVINLTSGLVSNDIAVNEHVSIYDLDLVDLVKYTPYVVDVASFISVINFSANFVAANSIVPTVDAVALAAVLFSVDNATTIGLVASRIATATGVISATVTGIHQITVEFTGGAHTVNSVVTTGGASQPTATINQSKNAPYYTIQSAINAASNAGGALVAVRWNQTPYTENLTLLPNVDLFAIEPDSRNTSPIGCVIVGNHILTAEGVLHINGFYFSSPAGDTFTINNTAGLSRIYLNNFVIDNSAGIAFNLGGAGGNSQVIANNPYVTAGLQIADLGSNGYIEVDGGYLYGGGAVPGFSMSTSSVVIARDTQIQGNTSTFDLTDVTANLSLNNVACVAADAIINFTAAASVSAYGCVFDTSSGAGFIVAGAGTFTYADITSIGSAIAIDGATTQVVSDWKPYGTAGNTSTAIRGTAGYDSTFFTVVDGFVSATGGGTISEIDTQSGNATPIANVIIVNGESSVENNTNGIISKGGVAGTGTQNEVDIVLTNRATGSATTVGASATAIITLPLGATPGVYTFDIKVAGFANAGIGTPLGCGFTIVGSARTDGTTATLIPTQVVDHFEEGALGTPTQVMALLAVSGNDALVTVTGKSDGAAGFTINWEATLNYTFVS